MGESDEIPKKSSFVATILRLAVMGYLFYCIGLGIAAASLEKLKNAVEASSKTSLRLRKEVGQLKESVRILEDRVIKNKKEVP